MKERPPFPTRLPAKGIFVALLAATLIALPGAGITYAGPPQPEGQHSVLGSQNPVAAARTFKWIDIDLSAQRLVAYQGNQAVFSTAVSTGLARYPTVQGTFRVYVKLRYDRMTGGSGRDYYDLPNVPHVMYFHRGYGIHGAYWHNNFGRPMSHGCVNLPLRAAAWLFNWTPVGTTVVVHR